MKVQYIFETIEKFLTYISELLCNNIAAVVVLTRVWLRTVDVAVFVVIVEFTLAFWRAFVPWTRTRVTGELNFFFFFSCRAFYTLKNLDQTQRTYTNKHRKKECRKRERTEWSVSCYRAMTVLLYSFSRCKLVQLKSCSICYLLI